MSFSILNIDFIPNELHKFLPDDVKFVLMKTTDDNDAVVQKLTELAVPGKPVFVKNVDSDTIQRFMKVKNVSNAIDLRPTNLELDIYAKLPDLARAFHDARVKLKDNRSIFTAIMIPLYVFETFRSFLQGKRVRPEYFILDMFSRHLEQVVEVSFDDNDVRLKKPSIHLVDIADPGGFHQPNRMNKSEYESLVQFSDTFSWSSAACIFDLEENEADTFVESFIASIPIGEGDDGNHLVLSFDSRFLGLPVELRRLLTEMVSNGNVINLVAIDTSEANLKLIYDYTHGRLQAGGQGANDKVDLLYLSSRDVEMQHILLQQYCTRYRPGARISIYYENPDESTLSIVESLATSHPVASLYTRLFEAHRHIDSYERLTDSNGLIVHFKQSQ